MANKKEVLRLNNTERTMEMYNKDFEVMSDETLKKLNLYKSEGYKLILVDNPKKASGAQKLSKNDIFGAFVEGSKELNLNKADSERFKKLYLELFNYIGFQTAKGFYNRLYNSINRVEKSEGSGIQKEERSAEEVYKYYVNFLNDKRTEIAITRDIKSKKILDFQPELKEVANM